MPLPVSTAPLERRLLWVGRREEQLTALVKPLDPYPVAVRAEGCCRDALALMLDWPPHLLILDTPEGPTPPFTWDTFLGEGLPAVDLYRTGGPWYQEDDGPRVLPVLFLTNDIPGPADLPLAWRYRVHCQPRYHITYFLQAWLKKPLNPPRLAPEPLLVIDFVRLALWVKGTPYTCHPEPWKCWLPSPNTIPGLLWPPISLSTCTSALVGVLLNMVYAPRSRLCALA